MSRTEAKSIAEKHGAFVMNTLSKNVDYVIYGEKSGKKLKQAQELDIISYSEAQWLEILNSN